MPHGAHRHPPPAFGCSPHARRVPSVGSRKSRVGSQGLAGIFHGRRVARATRRCCRATGPAERKETCFYTGALGPTPRRTHSVRRVYLFSRPAGVGQASLPAGSRGIPAPYSRFRPPRTSGVGTGGKMPPEPAGWKPAPHPWRARRPLNTYRRVAGRHRLVACATHVCVVSRPLGTIPG